jgi:hypothetical protein
MKETHVTLRKNQMWYILIFLHRPQGLRVLEINHSTFVWWLPITRWNPGKRLKYRTCHCPHSKSLARILNMTKMRKKEPVSMDARDSQGGLTLPWGKNRWDLFIASSSRRIICLLRSRSVGCMPGIYVAATIGLGGARRKGFLGIHIMGSSCVGWTNWDWRACFLAEDDSVVNDLSAVEGLAVDEVVGLLVRLDINFRCTLVKRTYRTWM